jgi:hypothetical protein
MKLSNVRGAARFSDGIRIRFSPPPSLSLSLCRIAKKLIRNHLPEWDLQRQQVERAGYMNIYNDIFARGAREAREGTMSLRGEKKREDKKYGIHFFYWLHTPAVITYAYLFSYIYLAISIKCIQRTGAICI